MSEQYFPKIAQELNLKVSQVASAAQLLSAGATVPFIARYRKEATGNLDEVAVMAVRDRLQQLIELDKRREVVLKSIQEQGKLTDDLKKKILAAPTLAVLEDIYLPYRPKRRTRGTIAKEKGLEPLAQKIFGQTGTDPREEAAAYVNPKKEVHSVDDALAGARDIIAEWINEDAGARKRLRQLFQERAVISSRVIRGKEQEAIKYKDYFQLEEPAKDAPSHRILAVRRGEREAFLTMRVLPPEEDALAILDALFLKGKGEDAGQVKTAIDDSYKRLLSLSLETEFRLDLKKRADREAITIFQNNLRELLMAPPLGQKRVLAIDPGYRTGCKVVCLDAQGKLLCNDTVYATGSERQRQDAAETIALLVKKYHIEVVAIGNGTASRETEGFIRGLGLAEEIHIVVVNESGASVYSACEAAREEFPDHDVTVRGAVSIGRRLMDPLAELVKIDPKSIGVGQYQHDVDQALLKICLDDTVVSCVNQVGVEINTASRQLLTYVSGIGPVRAQAIIDYRDSEGLFRGREDIRRVPGFGPKAFEQAAGFLRVGCAANPLDASAVHPESYHIVDAMARDLGCSVKDLMTSADIRKRVELEKYVSAAVGLPTLMDIRQELEKPGRDPREPFQLFSFQDGIEKMEDLSPGMKLPGVVTNVTAFGAFVDVGVHQDGLVHISQLSSKFVKDPHQVVRVHQKVTVKVLEVDLARRRIALTMRE